MDSIATMNASSLEQGQKPLLLRTEGWRHDAFMNELTHCWAQILRMSCQYLSPGPTGHTSCCCLFASNGVQIVFTIELSIYQHSCRAKHRQLRQTFCRSSQIFAIAHFTVCFSTMYQVLGHFLPSRAPSTFSAFEWSSSYTVALNDILWLPPRPVQKPENCGMVWPNCVGAKAIFRRPGKQLCRSTGMEI